jgi:hypothetical protein
MAADETAHDPGKPPGKERPEYEVDPEVAILDRAIRVLEVLMQARDIGTAVNPVDGTEEAVVEFGKAALRRGMRIFEADI